MLKPIYQSLEVSGWLPSDEWRAQASTTWEATWKIVAGSKQRGPTRTEDVRPKSESKGTARKLSAVNQPSFADTPALGDADRHPMNCHLSMRRNAVAKRQKIPA